MLRPAPVAATPRERHETAPDATPARQALPALASPASVIALQQSAGNAAVARHLAALARQAPEAAGGSDAPATAAPDPGFLAYLEGLWQDDPLTAIRMGAELIRPFPVLGLLPGAGADLIEMGQDLASVPRGDPILLGITGLTIGARSMTNIAGNGVGQLLEVTQLVQLLLGTTAAGATTSGFGAAADAVLLPLMALDATINGGVTGAKLWLTSWTELLDLMVTLEAAAGAVLGPVEDSEAWVSLLTNYIANQVGNALAFLNEWIGGGGLGGFPSGLLGQLLKSLKGLWPVIKKLLQLMLDWLIGFWNVHGDKAIERLEPPDLIPEDPGLEPTAPTSPAPDFGAFSAGPEWYGARLIELDAMRGCYQRGDAVVGGVGDQVAELMATASGMATDAAGGQEWVAEVRDGMSAVLGDVETRLGLLGDVESQAGAALERLSGVGEGIDGTLAFLEALEMPEIEIPTDVDLGEGAVLDAIEGAVGAATGAGAGLLQAGLDEVRSALEAAKLAALEPIRDVQASVGELRALLEALLEATRTVTAALSDMLSQLTDALAQCETVPDLLQMIVDQSVALSSEGDDASFSELQASWQELGPRLDEASEAARSGIGAGGSPASVLSRPAAG